MRNVLDAIESRLVELEVSKRGAVHRLVASRFALMLTGLLVAAAVCSQSSRAATVTFEASDEVVFETVPVTVGITVSDFTDVLLFQFTLQWNPSVVQFSSVANLAALPGFSTGNFGTGDTGSGRLTVSWDDGDLSGEDLVNGSTLFDINFTTIGLAGTDTPVAFTDIPTTRLVGVNVAGTPTPATFAQDDGSVTVVPEPVNAALGLFAMVLAGTMIVRRVFGRRTLARTLS